MNKKHLAFLGVPDYSVTTPIQKEILIQKLVYCF